MILLLLPIFLSTLSSPLWKLYCSTIYKCALLDSELLSVSVCLALGQYLAQKSISIVNEPFFHQNVPYLSSEYTNQFIFQGLNFSLSPLIKLLSITPSHQNSGLLQYRSFTWQLVITDLIIALPL